MSIYNQSITPITAADFNELLTETAVENLRLEFKRDAPGRGELLKKLSSFANKQTVVQHCQSSVFPPLQPQVSDAIVISENPERVCYVVFVAESFESPHFLNSRKGVYVRTDEFSTRFEPELPTAMKSSIC